MLRFPLQEEIAAALAAVPAHRRAANPDGTAEYVAAALAVRRMPSARAEVAARADNHDRAGRHPVARALRALLV